MTSLAFTPTITAFLGGSTGTGEMLVLFLVILILFGPRRLPEMARMFGRVMVEFRRAANEFRHQVMSIEEEAPARDVQVTSVSRPELPGSVQRAWAAGSGSPALPTAAPTASADATAPAPDADAPASGDKPAQGV